uniref:RNA-dependent RNA polymerase n=1 Tax=Rhizophagus diaphanum mitovirus 3 TaxID=2487744 RepID=A0A3S8QL55_9VIRU|nr:RNA-dependent RNA polymerase [Rhizophagus diaphanum mitovirus 3]
MKLFPMLPLRTPSSKPNTFKRFDSVFTAVKLLINLAGWSFATTLLSLLTLFYNRIVSAFTNTPGATIQALKFYRAYYLAFLRGGKAFAELTYPSDTVTGFESHSGVRSKNERIIFRIIDFRVELAELELPQADLLAFDRIVFAILSFDRIVSMASEPNFDTITAPSGFKYPEGGSFFDKLPTSLESLGITPTTFWAEVRRQAKLQRHVIMSTGGVNGPASWTAHTDAKAIMGNTALYKNFKYMAQSLGMNWLLQDLVSCVSLPSYDSLNDSMIHTGRLHHFEEWGGKVRVVAIVDYWTQILMSPLHNAIFHFLSKIPADGTFDQDAAIARVAAFTRDPNAEVYSYDLTAATDRLPISVQVEILSFLTTRQFANAWANLLVGRSYFHAPSNKSYEYAVGQPMGSKSSWAMLALTHHVIVRQAARSVSETPYETYALLGDDITLTGSLIAQAYLKIMSLLDVTINLSKSIVHYGDAKPAAEFCKRIFIEGHELTAIPVKLIAKTIMNGRLLPQLQNELFRRGFDTTSTWLLAFLTALTDLESGRFLAILNAIPTKVSSILNPISSGTKLAEFSKWFGDKWQLTSKDIIQAHMYIAITEALKRVDTLLRQAQIIHSAIESNAFGYSTFDASRILGWSYSDPEIDRERLAATMPQLSPTHPIVKAAQNEMDRLSALLADLQSGDTKVVARAQADMLNLFRSSLMDTWQDVDSARAQADRSLVQRALTLLADVILNRTTDGNGRKKHTVDFTVHLAYLNRLWNVKWTLGGVVLINSVKSKVLGTKAEATTRLTAIDSETGIIEMFHVPLSAKKARKVVSPTATPVAEAVKATVTAIDSNESNPHSPSYK